MFSWLSLGSAWTMATMAFCICGEGEMCSKMEGPVWWSSVASPGRKEELRRVDTRNREDD